MTFLIELIARWIINWHYTRSKRLFVTVSSNGNVFLGRNLVGATLWQSQQTINLHSICNPTFFRELGVGMCSMLELFSMSFQLEMESWKYQDNVVNRCDCSCIVVKSWKSRLLEFDKITKSDSAFLTSCFVYVLAETGVGPHIMIILVLLSLPVSVAVRNFDPN